MRFHFALLAAVAMLLVGCGRDDDGDEANDTGPAPREPASRIEGEITVSAAASLTEAFTELGDRFSEANPDAEVTFNFDSSSTLATQIIEGAPADVYASADEANMAELTEEGLIAGEPEVFARNELVIVTKPDNPEGVGGLADLADVGVVSLCGEEVPCGRFAAQVLDEAGISIPESSVTRGQNVKATLAAVAQGDAVAGIVYVTDAMAAGGTVDTVIIPADENAIAVYPIGVLAESGSAEVAKAFVASVVDDAGEAVLERFGFLPPE